MDHHVQENGARDDKMETFWLAESLKYFLLLFSDDALLSAGQCLKLGSWHAPRKVTSPSCPLWDPAQTSRRTC